MTDPVGAGQAPSNGPLDRLLELQELDLGVDRIEYRRRQLPERGVVADLGRRATELERRRQELSGRRDELASRQAELDEQVSRIRARIDAIDERLRSGRAGSYRDEQAMSSEAGSLDAHRRQTEDREIEVMEALEPVEEELAGLESELSGLETEQWAATQALADAEGALDAARRELESRRAPVVAAIAPELLATYEKLRRNLGGVGVAKLVDGACGGCHLRLPARERDELVHAPPGTIVHCEQCGRILVP